ncbi:OmpA family protein [Gandjariella thermophila]|uniref:OmpA-like domain-containing protein n=1 Tax=Gandjariella thermophila TaxID=1931992 RepID=A0A4D4JC07_9PSEU|nr:OmpA family protein [Gandjariella thermophila]GDY32550.1 hypothetical protein GTS_41830 [Gandjariella thermophila]
MIRTVLVLLAVAAGLLSLTGCDAVFASPPAPDACARMHRSTSGSAAGKEVWLIDRSASTRSADGGAPDYPKGLADTALKAVDAHHVVSVGSFDGSASTVALPDANLVTDSGKQNKENRDAADAQTRDCLTAVLRRAATAAPVTPGTDVLGAIAMAAQELRDTHGDRTIVVATDGLVTTGCADLSHIRVGNPALIDQIVRTCRDRGELRSDLSGTTLRLVGIGHPAKGQPQPSTTQLDWLQQLWSRLCAELHAARCEVTTAPMPATEPADPSGHPAAGAATVADPAVAFPPPDSGLTGPDGQLVFQLNADVLFDPNDATISPEGVATLTRIAGEVNAMPGASAVVNGYTEAMGTPEQNLALARQRAEAVTAVLSQHGVRRVTAQGHPGTAPLCPPPRVDDRAAQCNRRVDIVVSRAGS